MIHFATLPLHEKLRQKLCNSLKIKAATFFATSFIVISSHAMSHIHSYTPLFPFRNIVVNVWWNIEKYVILHRYVF